MQVSTHSLSFDHDELVLRMNVGINELMSQGAGTYILPTSAAKRFIIMIAPQSRTSKMQNRLGFYVLYEALKEGYSACPSCIGASQLR